MTKRHPEQYRHLVPEPFNKTQDAVGGLPQCSHCRKKFATWQLHGNFFKDMSRAIVVQCGTHSCLNPPQTLCSLTWRGPRCSRKTRSRTALVGTLVMLYTTCLQHCIVCGQWIASPKVMKLHYQQSHKDLISSHGQKATALCQTYTTGGSPCQYCGARLAQPKAHKLVCPVLWQFCLSFVQQRHVPCPGRSGTGSGDERCIRQSGQGQCSGLRGSTHRSELCSGGAGTHPKLPSWSLASADGPQTAHTLEDAAEVRGPRGKARAGRGARPLLKLPLWSRPWAGW